MDRLSIRFSPNQLQVLTELKDKYQCSYSLLIRAIVGSWITSNEDALEQVLNNEDNDEDYAND